MLCPKAAIATVQPAIWQMFSATVPRRTSRYVHCKQVTDRGDGTYTVEYCIPIEGTYTLTVMLAGHHIRGSPMGLTVYRCVVSVAVPALLNISHLGNTPLYCLRCQGTVST